MRRPLLTLLVVGGISEGFYLYLSRFQANNGPPLWTFLAVSAALFGAYAIGSVVGAKEQGQRQPFFSWLSLSDFSFALLFSPPGSGTILT